MTAIERHREVVRILSDWVVEGLKRPKKQLDNASA